jgi:hypothetical protein
MYQNLNKSHRAAPYKGCTAAEKQIFRAIRKFAQKKNSRPVQIIVNASPRAPHAYYISLWDNDNHYKYGYPTCYQIIYSNYLAKLPGYNCEILDSMNGVFEIKEV